MCWLTKRIRLLGQQCAWRLRSGCAFRLRRGCVAARSGERQECRGHAAQGAEALEQLGRQPGLRAVRAGTPDFRGRPRSDREGGGGPRTSGEGRRRWTFVHRHRVHGRTSRRPLRVQRGAGPRSREANRHCRGRHHPVEAVRRAGSTRARDGEHGRHQLPVDRGRDVDGDARHRHRVRQPVKPDRRVAPRHGRRFRHRLFP